MVADAVARIRLAALQNNLNRVRQSAPDCPVLAVVKADGYGHGLLNIANALDGADAFGVARFSEAGQLRRAGIDKDILVMSGESDANSLVFAREHRLTVVVYDESQLPVLLNGNSKQPLRIWLKIDTGMGRLGIAPQRFAVVLERLQNCPGIDPDICAMTHLACADDRADPMTPEQLRLFATTIGVWQGDVSIANSAGILGWPETTRAGAQLSYTGRNWIRPGLMLYGVSPLLDESGAACGLEPVMELEASLIAVHDVAAGSAVGYGAEWRAARDSRIGVINLGYADGYPWRLSNSAAVRIEGKTLPVIGRVSMDMLCVDLTDAPGISVGDRAQVWGASMEVAQLAAQAGTSPYELLTGVGQRVVRRVE